MISSFWATIPSVGKIARYVLTRGVASVGERARKRVASRCAFPTTLVKLCVVDAMCDFVHCNPDMRLDIHIDDCSLDA